ncbi:MAG: BCD family MFS transporter [Hyphomicrobiaceae bacterium]|nr:BCD family MFS transporter [Hyphomicrobiaceae bacterium]
MIQDRTAAATLTPPLGWGGIARLGLVMMSLGAILVLKNSTINRVMVVELALPAVIPGLLAALYHIAQVLRPKWGHSSDTGRRVTPWIIGGMAVLALGGFGATVATTVIPHQFWPGMILATVSFALVGMGTGAAGTCLLVLLAKRTAPERRGPAATIVWLMMIAGLAITGTIIGRNLEPYSPARLVEVAAVVSVLAVAVTTLAVWGIEGESWRAAAAASDHQKMPFRQALAEVWADRDARRLTFFVFVAMLGFFSEELVIDPFSAFVFGYTPGQSTKLSGALQAGVFTGMLALAIASGTRLREHLPLTLLMRGGCIGSAVAMLALVACGLIGPPMPLAQIVFLLGIANGVFSIAAIAWMMTVAGRGRPGSEGVRMGVWGAAQAMAAGVGGFAGAALSDVTRWLFTAPGTAYAAVFLVQALVFVVAAWLSPQASRYGQTATERAASGGGPRLQPAE